MANHIPVFDGYRVSAGPAQAAIQAVLNDLEALKASKDLEAICHGHKFGGVNPISTDRPSFAFRCFRLPWLLVGQTWQLLGSNPNWSAIVISSTLNMLPLIRGEPSYLRVPLPVLRILTVILRETQRALSTESSEVNVWINVVSKFSLCSGFGFLLRGARILMLASVSAREGRLGSFNKLKAWVEFR